MKTSLQNETLHNPKSFVAISSCSLRTMWVNYCKIEFIRAVDSKNIEGKIHICTFALSLKPQIW